jgi:hypothetical protein
MHSYLRSSVDKGRLSARAFGHHTHDLDARRRAHPLA